MRVMQFKLRDDAPPVSVAAWAALARKSLPAIAWNYVENGADDEVTLRANTASFNRWRLRQKCLSGGNVPNLSAKVVDQTLAMPLGLAPTGGAGMIHWTGDVAATRAAEHAGLRAILSTASAYTLEEVAEATAQNHWFQLYPFGDRATVSALLARAKAAGYTALFVTVDVPVLGNREGERTSGLTRPWTITPRRALDMLAHPAWLHGALRKNRLAAIHYRQRDAAGATAAIASTAAMQRLMQNDLSWDDLAWMRDQWQGPLYVKGVLDPDDAARAVEQIGAEGVVVSNHGGRQLDRALGAIAALPAIAARLNGKGEIYMDGGVRRGTDVITALCLGAKAVFIGRPYLYGLAAGGEQGVSAVLRIFKDEMHRAMVLMGCPDVALLDRSWLIPADGGEAET